MAKSLLRAPGSYILILVVAILVTFFTTFFTDIEVASKSELQAIPCGWPLPFVIRDDSRLAPPFPYLIECGPMSLESPTMFKPEAFIIDVALFVAGLVVVLLIAARIVRSS